jgi:S1-C subfamily serine protease
MNWKKTIALALTVAGMTITSAAVASDLATIRDATVLFTQNGRDVCSAVVVARPSGPVVYTASHCVEGGVQFTIKYEHDLQLEFMKIAAGTEFSVSVVSSSPWLKNDVAVLKFDAEAIPVLPAVDMVTKSDLVFGEPLIAVGYPDIVGTQQILINDGRFQEYDIIEEKPNGTFIRTNISIAPGFSGGGLYVLRDGEYILVGVASAKPVQDHPWLTSWFSNVLSGMSLANPGPVPGEPNEGATWFIEQPIISAS